MVKLIKLILGLAILVGVTPSMLAQSLDYGSMTNTVGLFATGTTTSGSILLPVVVGFILFCAGIGVWYRLSSKARIKS